MMESKSYHVAKYDEIYFETDAAYQLKIGDRLVWLPKSQVVIYKVRKTVEVKSWLYYKKNLQWGKK